MASFTITTEKALELSSLRPVARDLELQDLYNAHLHDEARRAAGALISGSWSFYAGSIARSWDAKGAEYMAEARAEYDRALAASRRAA